MAVSSPSPCTMKSIGASAIERSVTAVKCSPPQTIGLSGQRAFSLWISSRTIGHA